MNSMKIPVDPFGVAGSFMKTSEHWMLNGGIDSLEMLMKLMSNLQSASRDGLIPMMAQATNWKGPDDDAEAALIGQVKNYSKFAQKVHSAYAAWLREFVCKASGLSDKEKQCSTFWVEQVINSLSPSNYFWTNPSAVQKFLRSRGKSTVKGYENWLEDVHRGDNMVKIADTRAFKVGENIATTPGFVVYRNTLMELIQYSPRTETTLDIPIVFIQPWINKYYIFDLTEEKSFVSWLVDQGFTVFVVSWKNPSHDMRNIGFEDYMLRGALKSVEVAKEICGVDQVHAAGYCIGGTVLAALMAWLNREPPQDAPIPIRDFTLFATMVDYSSPGELGVYITEESIDMIEGMIKKAGYLDKKYMSAAFRLLRSNDLIWRYYSHNYLQGETPPKSEFLYWNSDSTRLPAAMCSFYLREFYLKNMLVKEDELILADRTVNLRRIEQPLYIVGAELDHICPWKETFKITGLTNGPVQYTLTTEGHITGMVNPPSPRSRRKFWTSEVRGVAGPEEWLEGQRESQGSWWPHWVEWLSRGCSRREPPPIGSRRYCPLEKAPGSYVKEE